MELTQKQEKEMNKHLGLGRHTKQEADVMKSLMEQGDSVKDAHKVVEENRKKKPNSIISKKMGGSEYIDFVKKWRESHKGVSWKDAMRRAGAEYRKRKGTKGAVGVSRVKKGKADTQDFSTKKGDLIKTGAKKGQKAFTPASRQTTPTSQSSY